MLYPKLITGPLFTTKSAQVPSELSTLLTRVPLTQVLLTCNFVIPLSAKQVVSQRLFRKLIPELLDDVTNCTHSPGKTMSTCAK